MTYNSFSGYYIPRRKAELIKAILPAWKGKRGDLREMSVKRLRAIFHRVRQKTIEGLVGK